MDLSQLIQQLDELSTDFENKGELEHSTIIDKVSSLLLTAEKELPKSISSFADILTQHFDVDSEEALAISQELFERYGNEGSEINGDWGFLTNYFPMSALPYKERREGPRKEDISPGKVKWWQK